MTAARSTVEIRPNRVRDGFTLVELLVVIGIIALLAALITPAVIGARTSARNAAIKAEIDMLHMAIMNYKNEYGSFPPCVAFPSSDPTQLLALKHIQRLFPRMRENPVQIAAFTNALEPVNAITRWLNGFTDDPSLPITGGSRQKMYDFDQVRIAPNGSYFPAGKKESPYVYIDATSYAVGSPPAVSVWSAGSTPLGPGFPGYFAQRTPNALGRWDDINQPPFNPDTFQILCAGLDGVFGTDDDLSNCWSGTRKQYLDSLKQ